LLAPETFLTKEKANPITFTNKLATILKAITGLASFIILSLLPEANTQLECCGGAPRRLLNSVNFGGFQRFSTSATRDCKRDIYSRFLYLARDTSLSLLIITPNHLLSHTV